VEWSGGGVRLGATLCGGGAGGSKPVPGNLCRRWGSRAGSVAVEAGTVRRCVRQGSGERKRVQARGMLWADCVAGPK
jgi:hypothetical protein